MQLLNRYDDSLEHFSQFIDMAAEIGGDPNLVKTAYHGRALIYMQKGDYGSALGDFTHVLKNADPSEYFESYYQAGRCYHAQGDFERAMEQYEVVLDFNPDHTNAQYYSGLIHLLQESYDSAIAAFNVVLRHNPNDVSALFSRGECYKHTGKWNFAARDFASVVALDPEAVKGYIEQAKALAKISDDRNDLEYSLYNTVVTIIQNSSCEKHNMTSKDLLDVRFKRGWLARRLGKHQQALEDFTVCIEKEVLLVESHFNRALIYRYYLHDDQKALEDLNTLLSLSPDDVSALLERGMIYFDTEHAEAATKDFEQVLELEPGNVSAIRLLDYCLVE
jgi:tetratricopeptide (TPR) repeat protein